MRKGHWARENCPASSSGVTHIVTDGRGVTTRRGRARYGVRLAIERDRPGHPVAARQSAGSETFAIAPDPIRADRAAPKSRPAVAAQDHLLAPSLPVTAWKPPHPHTPPSRSGYEQELIRLACAQFTPGKGRPILLPAEMHRPVAKAAALPQHSHNYCIPQRGKYCPRIPFVLRKTPRRR